MKRVFFQIHWFLGITAGLVISLVGVTGGMLSFQPQILTWMNPGVVTVEPEGDPKTPSLLIEAIQQQMPDKAITGLTLMSEADMAAMVRFAPEPGQRRGQSLYVNPYSGQILGQPAGRAFFIDVMRLHRWLLIGETGKQIVGASTIILIFLALTGIYFRWPKGKKKWSPKYWLTLRPGRSRRAFWWQLHAVIGTWLLPVYLLASVTGLYWSYDWYRSALYTISGVEQPKRSGGHRQTPPAAVDGKAMDRVWDNFKRQVPDYAQATLSLPVTDRAKFRYLTHSAAHERANDELELDINTGMPMAMQRYAEKPLNQKLMGSILPLHSGSFFGWPGLVIVMLASLAMPLFFMSGWYLYLTRRQMRGKRAV